MSGSTTVTLGYTPTGGVLVPSNAQITVTVGGAVAYQPRSSPLETITYNADGTVHTVTETDTGAVITYTYNADGTVHTESRLLNGVTTVRTFAYSNGNLTGVS